MYLLRLALASLASRRFTALLTVLAIALSVMLLLASFARTNGLNIVPVLTKADKCSQRERANRQNEWQELLGTRPIVTSSSNRYGIDNLWRALVETAVPQRVAPGTLDAAGAEAEQQSGATPEQEPQEQA